MRTGNTYVSISGKITRTSDKAILFSPLLKDSSFGKAEWFPRSQCLSVKESYDEIEGTFDILMASEWILGQKGMLKIAQEQKIPAPPTPKPAVPAPPGLSSTPSSAWDDDIPF